jgi:hypothetical protein
MNLDSRISAAVDETTNAPLDLEARLGDLRTLRRRRATTRAGAALAAIAVVAAGVVITRYQPATTPQPAPAPHPVQLRGGAVLALTADGAVTQVKGAPLPHVPAAAEPRGPLTFSIEGTSLVYAVDGRVHQMDLRSGEDVVLRDCPDASCTVAYSFSEVLTQSATAEGNTIMIEDSSGTAVRLPIGARPTRLAWSPARSALVYATRRAGRDTLEVVDIDTGAVTRLLRLQTGDRLLGTPVWSPSGHQIAFVTRFGPAGESALISLQTVTTVGDPLVTDVHMIDRCVCADYVPGVAWSPDSNRLLVTGVGRAQGSGGPVFSVLRDGSVWRLDEPGSYGHGLAWQPPVSAQQ